MLKNVMVIFISSAVFAGGISASNGNWEKRHFPEATNSNPYGRPAPAVIRGTKESCGERDLVSMTRGELKIRLLEKVQSISSDAQPLTKSRDHVNFVLKAIDDLLR